MGKKRKTRAQKERHAARLAKAQAGEFFERSRAKDEQAAARLGPQIRRREQLQEDGTTATVTEVLQFWVERRETTFGFKHPLLPFAMFGKTRTDREGPFASWSAARQATKGDPGKIVSEWSAPRTVGSVRQAEDGTVVLVPGGRAAADAAVEAALTHRRPQLLVIQEPPDIASDPNTIAEAHAREKLG